MDFRNHSPIQFLVMLARGLIPPSGSPVAAAGDVPNYDIPADKPAARGIA
jgi:hypothetical protein